MGVLFGAGMLLAIVIILIGLLDIISTAAAKNGPAIESNHRQLGIEYQLLGMAVIFLVLRLPCSSWSLV